MPVAGLPQAYFFIRGPSLLIAMLLVYSAIVLHSNDCGKYVLGKLNSPIAAIPAVQYNLLACVENLFIELHSVFFSNK